MEADTQLRCARHGVPTRITCVECNTPICPDCAIRTEVGLKCPDHATRRATRRSRTPQSNLFGGVVVLVAIAVVLGLVQAARRSGTGSASAPRCPTQSAPDVGIGAESGTGHWTELSTSGLCGRYDAAVAWTGKEMLVWGGENCAGGECPSDQAPHLGDGAAYTPATNKWKRLATSPLAPREAAATAWTGTELLIWGGTTGNNLLADGASYDPVKNKWLRLSQSPLAPRTASASAWTGKELLVWGGSDLADGAAYDPAAGKWRTLAPSPLIGRSATVSAWTGKELVIWGGVTLDGNRAFTDGAAYDPATDKWRPIATGPLAGRYTPAATWSGKELLIWGGNAPGSSAFGDGAAYDPATDKWRPLPAAPVASRSAAAAVWSGKELLVWGGVGDPGSGPNDRLTQLFQTPSSVAPLGDGAAYDPATDKWRTLERVSLLGRGYPIAVWDGQGMIVWGGLTVVDAPASASDGVRYTP